MENSQKPEGEAPAVDLAKAIKRMKDDDFFEKEYAKDLKKRQKEKEAYMKQAREVAQRRQEEKEETKSL